MEKGAVILWTFRDTLSFSSQAFLTLFLSFLLLFFSPTAPGFSLSDFFVPLQLSEKSIYMNIYDRVYCLQHTNALLKLVPESILMLSHAMTTIAYIC